MSRKAHRPNEQTRGQVAALASFGVPQDDIATYIGIDPKTLRKHYRRELDTAETRANAAVAKRLYEHATGDSVPAAIFWLKARAGWRERQDADLEREAKRLEVEKLRKELEGGEGDQMADVLRDLVAKLPS